MSVWNAGAQPLSFGRTPVLARHIGRGPGLVDEDELLGIEIELTVEPSLALFLYVCPVLLAGMGGLFL